MSCSARLPVYILIISAFFNKYRTLYLLGIYLAGIIFAFLTAQIFNKTVFKNKETPFVMELPTYRLPTFRNIIYHMWDKTQHYLKKISTIILLGVVIIWALEYFPRNPESISQISTESEGNIVSTIYSKPEKDDLIAQNNVKMESERLANSYLGRVGKVIEPAMRPLGFDWKMSISLLAGLPAKEIIVSTMGVLYQNENDESTVNLQQKLQDDVYESGKLKGKKVFNHPAALAYLVFILIYFPCIGVIATIKNESGSWKWAVFTIVYTTLLAWMAAFIVYNIGILVF